MAGDAFWEVLAGHLGEGATAGAHGFRRPWPVTQTWDPGLRFVLLSGGLRDPTHLALAEGADGRAVVAGAGRRPADAFAPRSPRLLSDAERFALTVLRGSGAFDLDEGYTAAGLRRAYRRLALRWHPDRHAQASPAERALLARTFARITDAYRLLAGVAAEARQAA